MTEAEVRKIVQDASSDTLAKAMLATSQSIEKLREGAGDVPEWAKETWETAISSGVTDGTRPNGLTTRVETIAMIERRVKNG